MASDADTGSNLRALLADCTQCGDCLEACPTYVISGVETESPRGRISLLQHALDHPGEDRDTLVTRIDSCTGCLRCVSACPEDVRYQTILPLARALVNSQRTSDPSAAAARRLAVDTLTHPWTLRRMTPLVRAARRVGTSHFPEPVRTIAELIGELPSRSETSAPVSVFTPAVGEAQGRVGLLRGCVQRVVHPDLLRATVAVLAAQGFDVIAPEEPDCCGALHLHRGDRASASRRAQRTIDAFTAVGGVDRVLTSAGGCLGAMKHYGELIDEPQSAAFGTLVSDVCEFLAAHPQRINWKPLALTVAWHESCQQANARQADPRDLAPARDLLGQVPGLRVIDTREPGLCCGAVGTYRLDEPLRAGTLGVRRAQQLIDAGADAIVASSPDCADQISRHAAALGHPLAVYNPLVLLAKALPN